MTESRYSKEFEITSIMCSRAEFENIRESIKKSCNFKIFTYATSNDVLNSFYLILTVRKYESLTGYTHYHMTNDMRRTLSKSKCWD